MQGPLLKPVKLLRFKCTVFELNRSCEINSPVTIAILINEYYFFSIENNKRVGTHQVFD